MSEPRAFLSNGVSSLALNSPPRIASLSQFSGKRAFKRKDFLLMSTSAERMRRMRGCKRGEHSQCRVEICDIRSELERKANETMYARSVLDYCTDHGVAWTELGSELPEIRRKARQQIPSWLQDEYSVTWGTMIESAYIWNLR